MLKSVEIPSHGNLLLLLGRGVEPRANLHPALLFVFYEVLDVFRAHHVAYVDALLLTLYHELVRLRPRSQDPDHGRVRMLRIALLRGLPVPDEIPRVPWLVLDVVQIVRRDAVRLALGEVLVDVAPDADLGDADEKYARAQDDCARGSALGDGEGEVAARGREVGSHVRHARRFRAPTRGRESRAR